MNIYLQAAMWTVFACFAIVAAVIAIAYGWSALLDAWGWMREREYHRTKHRVAADMRYYACWFSESKDAMEAINCYADELSTKGILQFDMSRCREEWEKKTRRRNALGQAIPKAERTAP